VDLLLAGHFHVGYTGNTAAHYEILGHAALVVQAGTAISTRGRGQANSFNVIKIHRPEIVVERWEWNSGAATFVAAAPEHFRLVAGVWSPPVSRKDR
jgi:hypothetical protein